MINPGDLRLLAEPIVTLATDPTTRQPIRAYRLLFSIRGKGQYEAVVPIEGYSAALAKAAMEKVAGPVIDTLDMFGG